MGLIILLVVMIFSGGDKKPDVPATKKSLVSYVDTDAEVSMTVEGPINADTNHQQYSITVSRNNVTYEQTRGYEASVVKSRTYANNQTAYYDLLAALTRANFTSGNDDKALKEYRALCPLGNRYIFRLTQDGENLEQYWITSCGGLKTYNGDFGLTTTLLKSQVPDFASLNSNFGSGY